MNSDDIFFEDDDAEEEEEATFPDEDIAEDEVEEATFEDVVDFKEIRTYEDKEPGYAYANFLRDPWPPTALIITLIGLGIVLLTPSSIWAPNRYGILGVYFLISAGLVGIVFSLITWSRAGTHRLRWAGPVNIIIIVLSVVVGTADSISWILNGVSIIPVLDSSLLLLSFMLVFFSLYTLWMIQRSLDPEAR